MPAFMPRKLILILVAIWLALPASLARSAEPVSANDTARFLAGLSPSAGSPLAALTNDGLWREHAHYFDSIFEREDGKLSKVRAFSQSQLTDKHDALLYFFSGPDFLYATNLFPNASTYVLAGLEPAGDIPQLTNLSRPAVAETLHNLENSLGTILNYSFFITQKMKTQLSTGPVYGTLPVLYVFMARTGKTIHEVNFVGLDPEGNVEDLGPVGDGRKVMKSTSAAKGVKIVFSDGSGRNQTLYYFSTNLADDGVRRSGFLAFCAKLGPADAFIKSASYLLARRRLQHGAKLPAAAQRTHPRGRQRYSAGVFRSEKVAAAAVRPLRRPPQHFRTLLSAGNGRTVPQRTRYRSISASVIAGSEMNPICCSLRRRRPRRATAKWPRLHRRITRPRARTANPTSRGLRPILPGASA